MAQRISGEVTCDQCYIRVSQQTVYLVRSSRKGRELHFCSKECFDKKPSPKEPTLVTSDIIDDDQAVQFIFESNGIEEIHFDPEIVRQEWMLKNTGIPEIYGHAKALRYVIKRFGHAKLTVEVIVKLHKLLMSKLLPPECLGLRRDLVRVGGRMCPYPIEIHTMLLTWLEKVNAMKNPTEEEIWQTHLAYEYIHPFIDGNGRSGRLLWLWLRYKHGFNYKCIYNLSKYRDYYPRFDSFNWDEWKK